jgi:hypothetical protein
LKDPERRSSWIKQEDPKSKGKCPLKGHTEGDLDTKENLMKRGTETGLVQS